MIEAADATHDLRDPANAAVAWLNERRGSEFRLTGIVPEGSVATDAPFELGLVLCEGDRCLREQVRFTPRAQGFDFALLQGEDESVPALLDPPAGVRSSWIDDQLARHDFILLLFYRGRW